MDEEGIDPVLLAGFVVHRQAGRIGSRAVAYLVNQWNGELVARIDSHDFMNFTTDRPESRFVADSRTIKWPDTLVYLARPEGANRDFLLLVGFEPNLRWKGFVGDLAAYAGAAGVRTPRAYSKATAEEAGRRDGRGSLKKTRGGRGPSVARQPNRRHPWRHAPDGRRAEGSGADGRSRFRRPTLQGPNRQAREPSRRRDTCSRTRSNGRRCRRAAKSCLRRPHMKPIAGG